MNIEARDPEDAYASPDAKGMAAAVTYTAQISQNRSIVLQTYLDRDSNVREFHKVLDKFHTAIERQEAKSQLEENKANLEVEEMQLRRSKEDYSNIEVRAEADWQRKGKKGPFKMSETEEGQKQTAKITIERFAEAVTKRKAEIARLTALIADGATAEGD